MLKSETGKTDTKSKWPPVLLFALLPFVTIDPPPPRQIPAEDAATRKNQKAVFFLRLSLIGVLCLSGARARQKRACLYRKRRLKKKSKIKKTLGFRAL